MTQTPPAAASTKMPSDQRKAQIIDAATGLFAHSGYTGTSLRDVAEKCGMTKAALYYHYPDKESLLKAVVETRMVRLNRLMVDALEQAGDIDPVSRMRAFLMACARHIDADRAGWVVGARIFWSIEAVSDRTEMVKLRDRFEGMLRTEIEAAMNQGLLRQEDPGLVTRMMLSWLNYIPRWHKPGGAKTVEDFAGEFFRLSLQGVQADPA